MNPKGAPTLVIYSRQGYGISIAQDKHILHTPIFCTTATMWLLDRGARKEIL